MKPIIVTGTGVLIHRQPLLVLKLKIALAMCKYQRQLRSMHTRIDKLEILQCHYAPDAERNYTFIGTLGRVENIGDCGECEVHVWNRRGPRNTPDVIYKVKPPVKNSSHGGADAPIVQSFLDFVRFDAKTNTSPIAARNSVATGVLGHYSMRNGCNCQEIPQLPKEVIEYFENGQKKK